MKLCQLGERVNVRNRAVELAGVQRSNRIAHQPLGGFAQLHERSFGAVGEVCEIGRSLQKYRGGICVASRMSRKAEFCGGELLALGAQFGFVGGQRSGRARALAAVRQRHYGEEDHPDGCNNANGFAHPGSICRVAVTREGKPKE